MAEVEEILRSQVYIRGDSRPFGELTLDDARMRGAELKVNSGWGPTVRVASVARAWLELAQTMQSERAATVGELPAEKVIELAPKLWVVPPGGSLL